MYYELVKIVNSIDTRKLVKKIDHNAKIKVIEDKIPSINNLVTNASLTAKINEVKNKIPSISNLATADDLTAIENKIPNVSDLIKIQVLMQKLNILEINISLYLIIISSQITYLMQR